MDEDMYQAAANQYFEKALHYGDMIWPFFVAAIVFGLLSGYFFYKESKCLLVECYLGRALTAGAICLICLVGTAGTYYDYKEAMKNPELYIIKGLGDRFRSHYHPVPRYVLIP